MSTKLGTLTLDLIAKIGSFVGPIKDAEKQTKQSFESMRKHVNSFGSVAVAGAAAAGAAAFAMAKNYADAAQELRIFSSIANASNQEFQAMAVGAQTMGISQEKLADQLKDFNEKLGEFITIGSGGAVDFFEQIAIKTEGSAEGARKLALEMQNLSGPKALQLYVDKLEEAGVTQQQMSFYLESMASDTTNLIPLLKQGGEGFKFWADAAERAGVIMDESAIAKAAELKVQLGLLDLQVQGATNQFIQGLIPALVSVGDAMSDATVNTNMMADAGELLGEVFKGVAATGMGVYATIKLLSNSIAGLAYDANVAKKHMEVESGWKKWTGINFFKSAILGTAAARTSENSGIAMAAQDNNKVIEDVANSINRLYSDTASAATKQMAKIQSSQAGVTKGSQEWVKKQNEATQAAKSNAKATSDAAKAQREYNQAVELGKRLIYEYGDEQLRIAKDLENDLEDIRSASLKQEAKDRYSEVAKLQAEARKKAYFAELEDELFGHRKTEEDKLKDELNINKLRLDAQRGLNKNELDLRKAALEDKARLELSYIQADKLARADSAMAAWGGTYSDMTGTGDQFGIESEKFNRFDQSQELFDAQMALAESAEQREAIWQAHHERMTAIELSYNESKRALAMASAGDMLGNMTDLMGSLLGEQSAGYKAMFGIQKAFAIAQILLNAPESYSKAFNSMVGIPLVGPVLAPIAGGVAIATQLAQLATVKSVSLSGMAHDGIDNIPKEGTWLLDKGERVVDARTNGDLKDFIANSNNGPKVIINVPAGHTANHNVGADGTVTVDVVRQEIAGAFNNVRRSNSTESRVFQETFGLSPSR
ncbi:hypothetical protein G0029_05365 [Acinetobacter sp. YH12138]|uniref:hypothetical protein n=1 Tax=Acinetobacter sp. YH12138 TaxID=2601122 RepID=UPI0015D3CB45|nr:hypothetical protein [Acinetobacter sp. YH12138]QOW49272.1 hypothetical protein G0029_05365 [Acinetobacter sp. YH12138]